MFAANAYSIRFADSNDSDTLAGLAERESEAPLAGRVLVGWIDGTPAAALARGGTRHRRFLPPQRSRGRRPPCARRRDQGLRDHAFAARAPARGAPVRARSLERRRHAGHEPRLRRERADAGVRLAVGDHSSSPRARFLRARHVPLAEAHLVEEQEQGPTEAGQEQGDGDGVAPRRRSGPHRAHPPLRLLRRSIGEDARTRSHGQSLTRLGGGCAIEAVGTDAQTAC